MDKIYVEGDLPNSCVECPCEYEYYCNVFNCELNTTELYEKRHPNCPLKPLTDRLAEERKMVVQEIRDYVCNKNRHIDLERVNGVDTFFYSIHCRNFLKKLEQIERCE